ncbi:MAG: cytochrome c3 family protein [Gammaproteobacteria bacterium]|nr:cytochrome c3 family protein [Gammaproteobacteria bacterium]
MNSISDSYHNLGSTNIRPTTPNGGTPANHSLDTAEIRVFCHTPHGGDNTAVVPIWNRRLIDPAVYTRYSSLGTSTFDATEAPVGSVTIARLSCHAGTQAIDSVINAPGSGKFNSTGQRIGNNFAGGDVCMIEPWLCTGIVQNLGLDLSNDHPVSMQYGGGGVNVQNPMGPTNDPDFVAAGNPKPHPQAFTLNNMNAPTNAAITRLWWVERYAESISSGNRDRTDIILYTRLEGETDVAGGEQPFVECGSCHDPHNVDNPTFLRVSNGIPSALELDFPNAIAPDHGSALCLTCHIK